jgi:hypothetical protein
MMISKKFCKTLAVSMSAAILGSFRVMADFSVLSELIAQLRGEPQISVYVNNDIKPVAVLSVGSLDIDTLKSIAAWGVESSGNSLREILVTTDYGAELADRAEMRNGSYWLFLNISNLDGGDVSRDGLVGMREKLWAAARESRTRGKLRDLENSSGANIECRQDIQRIPDWLAELFNTAKSVNSNGKVILWFSKGDPTHGTGAKQRYKAMRQRLNYLGIAYRRYQHTLRIHLWFINGEPVTDPNLLPKEAAGYKLTKKLKKHCKITGSSAS